MNAKQKKAIRGEINKKITLDDHCPSPVDWDCNGDPLYVTDLYVETLTVVEKKKK